MEKKKTVCLISSSGGHLEQIKQLKDVYNKYDCFYAQQGKNTCMKMKITVQFVREK